MATIHAPTCLSCGWYGEGQARRQAAVPEGEQHERGDEHPPATAQEMKQAGGLEHVERPEKPRNRIPAPHPMPKRFEMALRSRSRPPPIQEIKIDRDRLLVPVMARAWGAGVGGRWK
ncbi:MAG TPA: hypothetical protein VMH33_04845 [Solirubrobacterales bacterium]|nr:hypothetical protein [Solirubrobacterales bacterium]